MSKLYTLSRLTMDGMKAVGRLCVSSQYSIDLHVGKHTAGKNINEHKSGEKALSGMCVKRYLSSQTGARNKDGWVREGEARHGRKHTHLHRD